MQPSNPCAEIPVGFFDKTRMLQLLGPVGGEATGYE